MKLLNWVFNNPGKSWLFAAGLSLFVYATLFIGALLAIKWIFF